MISVVLTFKNEESCLNELLDRLENTLDDIGERYEIIFVDDQSEDKSFDILQDRRKKNTNIKIIKTARNYGNGPCLVYGLRKSKGNFITYLDCDLQDPPELIKKMYQEILNHNYDLINTKRKKRPGESFFKLFLTRLAYKIINFFTDNKIIPNAGDFKMFRRSSLDIVLKSNDQDPFTRGFSNLIGKNQYTIEYVREKRAAGESHYSLISTLNPYKELLRGITFNDFKLIYIIFFMSLLFILLSALSLIFLENVFYFILILFLFTIQLSVGVLGLYIKKLFDKFDNKSLVIDQEIGFE